MLYICLTNNNKMEDTINFLEDYFSTTNNILIQDKIKILRAQIDLEITKAQIQMFNELKNN